MRDFRLVAALFVAYTPSLAQLGTSPERQNGEAIVVNKCAVPVYYVSMGDTGSLGILLPDEVYREQFRLRYLGAQYPREDAYGGVSIMLSPNQTIAAAVDKQQAFFQSTITQFEYTYHPLKPPGLWYDISNVNGYVFNTDNGWDGVRPWPFQEDGLIVEGTSKDCATVLCPGGNPNGNSTCVQAYTHSKDDWASHGCQNSNSIVLTLCTGFSALKDVIDVQLVTSGPQKLYDCLS